MRVRTQNWNIGQQKRTPSIASLSSGCIRGNLARFSQGVYQHLSPTFQHHDVTTSTPLRANPLKTAGTREIWIVQSGLSKREKLYCPHVDVSWQERHWNQATFPIGDGIKCSQKEIYNSQNHITLQKVMTHFVSPASHLAPKIVVCLASPGGIIAVLFWITYVVRRQIKPGIL